MMQSQQNQQLLQQQVPQQQQQQHQQQQQSSSSSSSSTSSNGPKGGNQPKKPRLVFTDLQRRTLQAIFKETKRPSKEMQITISQQLGLELSTVGNFFMNARRRSQDKWMEDPPGVIHGDDSSTSTIKSNHGNNKNKTNVINGSVPTSVLTMGSNVIVSCTWKTRNSFKQNKNLKKANPNQKHSKQNGSRIPTSLQKSPHYFITVSICFVSNSNFPDPLTSHFQKSPQSPLNFVHFE